MVVPYRTNDAASNGTGLVTIPVLYHTVPGRFLFVCSSSSLTRMRNEGAGNDVIKGFGCGQSDKSGYIAPGRSVHLAESRDRVASMTSSP